MRHLDLNPKRIFLAGLLIILPTVVTAYVLWVIFSYVDGILEPMVTRYLGFKIPGVGLLALVVSVFLAGLFASNFLGARIVHLVTSNLEKIPLWSPVYRAVRDISEVFLRDRSSSFRHVGLIHWPRTGVYAMVFVTSEGPTPADPHIDAQLVSVFLPTTPNPTSGFYMMVPRNELIYLDLSVEQALKVIISGGAAYDPSRIPSRENSTSVARKTDSSA